MLELRALPKLPPLFLPPWLPPPRLLPSWLPPPCWEFFVSLLTLANDPWLDSLLKDLPILIGKVDSYRTINLETLPSKPRRTDPLEDLRPPTAEGDDPLLNDLPMLELRALPKLPPLPLPPWLPPPRLLPPWLPPLFLGVLLYLCWDWQWSMVELHSIGLIGNEKSRIWACSKWDSMHSESRFEQSSIFSINLK